MSGAARVTKDGEQDEDLMPFAEIGRQLGMTPQGAQWVFRTALSKLRQNALLKQLWAEQEPDNEWTW